MELPAVLVVALCARGRAVGGDAASSMVPLVFLVLFGMIFNTANGFVNGYNLFLSGRIYTLNWLFAPRFIGGLFELVSTPNYFGEIVQWIGWAVMTWSLAGLSFALFTVANLLPRGIGHHRWYREHFEDYPDRRRAIVPFIL